MSRLSNMRNRFPICSGWMDPDRPFDDARALKAKVTSFRFKYSGFSFFSSKSRDLLSLLKDDSIVCEDARRVKLERCIRHHERAKTDERLCFLFCPDYTKGANLFGLFLDLRNDLSPKTWERALAHADLLGVEDMHSLGIASGHSILHLHANADQTPNQMDFEKLKMSILKAKNVDRPTPELPLEPPLIEVGLNAKMTAFEMEAHHLEHSIYLHSNQVSKEEVHWRERICLHYLQAGADIAQFSSYSKWMPSHTDSSNEFLHKRYLLFTPFILWKVQEWVASCECIQGHLQVLFEDEMLEATLLSFVYDLGSLLRLIIQHYEYKTALLTADLHLFKTTNGTSSLLERLGISIELFNLQS